MSFVQRVEILYKHTMKKFVILDDVFDESARKEIREYDYRDGMVMWRGLNEPSIHREILDICGRYFDLSSAVGYELWCNKVAPGWHFDKDELAFEKRRQLRFPLCSIVYYPLIDDLEGGDLCTEDLRVKPKTNRLVVFSRGIKHGVEASTGTRMAVSMNPWSEIPLSHDPSRT